VNSDSLIDDDTSSIGRPGIDEPVDTDKGWEFVVPAEFVALIITEYVVLASNPTKLAEELVSEKAEVNTSFNV
jgi:hypothetical protein